VKGSSNDPAQHSDSESFSDDAKKNRKKRNAYQKIADDIRVKLLEAVKSGETLKSAAKRFKINYSSAKSILHTFRKEGRILKKSAQERTTKKKLNVENEQPVKTPKLNKKDSTNSAHKNHNKAEAPLMKKVKVEATPMGNHSESLPLGSLSTRHDNYMNTRGEDHQGRRTLMEKEDYMKVSGMKQEEYHNQSEIGQRVRKMSAQHEENTMQNMQKLKFYDNMYPGYYEEFFDFAGNNQHMYGDNHHHQPQQHNNYMFFPQQFDHSEMPSIHHKTQGQDDFQFLDSNAFLFSKGTNGHLGFDEKMEGQQNLFKEALRKTSFFSYTSNGFRKGSFDMM